MTTKLKWTKDDGGWIVRAANFEAKVNNPSGPLGFSHWSVISGNNRGGSGGTSSVSQSKRAAEHEVERFLNFLNAN